MSRPLIFIPRIDVNGMYLLQTLRKIVECVNDAVIVHHFVGIYRIITSTSPQNAGDEFSLSRSGRVRKRIEEVFNGRLQCRRWIHSSI